MQEFMDQSWDDDPLVAEHLRRAERFADRLDGLVAYGTQSGKFMVARYDVPAVHGAFDVARLGERDCYFARLVLPQVISQGDDGLRRRVHVSRDYMCALPTEDPESDIGLLAEFDDDLEDGDVEFDDQWGPDEPFALDPDFDKTPDLIAAVTNVRVDCQIAPDEYIYFGETPDGLEPTAFLSHQSACRKAIDFAREVVPSSFGVCLDPQEYDWLIDVCDASRGPVYLPQDLAEWPLPRPHKAGRE